MVGTAIYLFRSKFVVSAIHVISPRPPPPLNRGIDAKTKHNHGLFFCKRKELLLVLRGGADEAKVREIRVLFCCFVCGDQAMDLTVAVLQKAVFQLGGVFYHRLGFSICD